MDLGGSLGFDTVGGKNSQGLEIPRSEITSSGNSIGFSAAYATPQGGMSYFAS